MMLTEQWEVKVLYFQSPQCRVLQVLLFHFLIQIHPDSLSNKPMTLRSQDHLASYSSSPTGVTVFSLVLWDPVVDYSFL